MADEKTDNLQEGDTYECNVCGLVVTVDEECGCEEACDIICCSEPMHQRRVEVK